MREPDWQRINPANEAAAKRSEAIREGRQLAYYMHGPNWTDAHDHAVTNYLRVNGHEVS